MLSGVLGSILIVRSLTREQYGTFSYFLWLSSILNTLGTLAFPSAVTKITSELRGNGQDAGARSLSRWVAQCLLAGNVLLSVGFVLWAFHSPGSQKLYWLMIALSLAPNAITAILRSTLWGRENYRPVSLTIGITSVLQMAFIGIAYIYHWGVAGFLAALLSVSAMQALGLSIVLGRPIQRRSSRRMLFQVPPVPILRRYWAFAAPATLVLCYEVVVWQRSEIFFLQRWSSLDQVGFYNLAYTVFSTLLALGWALLHGFYPAFSKDYGAGQWPRIRDKVRQGMIVAALFAVPLTFGGVAILHNLTVFLYTPKMLPMVPVAQILLLGLLPGVITGLFSMLVNSVGGVWIQVRLGLAMSVVSVCLDLVLVPRFGALGAAVANTATQFTYSALLIALVQRKYQIILPWRSIVSILIAGSLTTFLVPLVTQSWFTGIAGLVMAVALATTLYIVAVFTMGYVRSLKTLDAQP